MAHQPTAFGMTLRRLRTAAALSQEDLAARSGLSPRGISDLERGVRRTPYLATVRLIANALALTPAERETLLAAARPQAAPDAAGALDAVAAPLPSPLTSLIGRQQELAALTSWLSVGRERLVTVTGAGGTGKTRLALEVGARLGSAFVDGVIFVDLAPLTDAALVVPAIAAAVGVRERRGHRLIDTLARFLAAKRMLLIVDNVEHVIPAASEVAALLAASPGVAVLATSREALRVRGEREFHLEPLPLPRFDGRLSIGASSKSPAVALFVERAAANRPGFSFTAENAADIAGICRRLDGLPLAIELAAARIRLLSPPMLLTRLDQQLTLLTGGSRDLPPRQRTMRDAIAWSYDLLGDAEQRLFRRLAVFTGGWSLDAAEAIGSQENVDALAVMEALLAANLVRALERPSGERRFSMVEMMREFGLERMAERGELDEVGSRHTEYFVALAQAGEPELATADRRAWLADIEAEQDNLRTALCWLRDHEEGAGGLRLAAALGELWRLQSRNSEGRAWLETFLAQTASDEFVTGDRIAALRWAGELAGLQGDVVAAEARLRESLDLARGVGDAAGIAGALGAIGSALLQSGEVAGCVAPFMEAIALTRQLGDSRQTAFLLAYVAVAVGNRGDLAVADALVAESEELLRDLGDALSFEASLVPLVQALLALMRGDADAAANRFATARSLGNALDARAISAFAAAGLGEIDLGHGRIASAAHHFRVGLNQGWEGDYPLGIAWNLDGLARVEARRGALESAALIYGAVDAFRGAMQALPWPVTLAHNGDVARVRAELGEEEFLAAWKSGRVAPLEDLVAEAVACAGETTPMQK